MTDKAWAVDDEPSRRFPVYTRGNVGAQMSHAVIVSRELGIPTVVSVTGATSVIPDGAHVEVDGTAGVVRILDD
jgi:rifampicin phosphotransferase